MGGSLDRKQLLREIKLRRIPQAIKAAKRMSIDSVVAALEADVAPKHPEACDNFVIAWLDSLDPVERLSAANKTLPLYLLELFWLPQAADKTSKRLLDSAARAMTHLEGILSDLQLTAEIPKSSLRPEQAAELSQLGQLEVRALADRLRAAGQEIVIV